MSEQNPNPTGVPQEPQPQQLPPAQPAAQAYLPPPSATAPANYAPVATQTTNIWAVVSLVCSVLSWLGLFGIGGIIGIITGVVARNEIAASRGAQGGDGIALAGIILGAINVLLSCIGLMCAFAFILIPLGMIPFAVGR